MGNDEKPGSFDVHTPNARLSWPARARFNPPHPPAPGTLPPATPGLLEWLRDYRLPGGPAIDEPPVPWPPRGARSATSGTALERRLWKSQNPWPS